MSDTITLTRTEINLLPLKKYEGTVTIVRDDGELAAAARALRSESVLGFDIEVRPSFKSGERFPPALVQLAGRSGVFLVQLKKVGALHPLAELLADPGVVKAGVAVSHDIAKLHEVMRFAPAGFVELGRLAARKGIRAEGVRTLAAQVLGFRISKGAQCSNWERAELAPAQVTYAATDAWVCREIHQALEKMADRPQKSTPAAKKREDHPS